jgi:hypothetical protein
LINGRPLLLLCGVDRSRNQLFSGAGFARNEDGAIRFSNSAYLPQDLFNRCAATDDVFEVKLILDFFHQVSIVFFKLRL